jgi:lysophospholipase L1-like esterase
VALRGIFRFTRFQTVRVGCAVAVAALAVAGCAHGTTAGAGAAGIHGRPGYPDRIAYQVPGTDRVRVISLRDPFGGCETRIAQEPRHIRTLAIVGASYTAGVGPDNPKLSWAADLARKLRWNSVIYGVPGAGYVQAGTDDLGPMGRMLGLERLPGLKPSLVIVQAGHDDGGVPAARERSHVIRTIDLIRAEAPHARIALLTVFSPPTKPIAPALYQVDHTIVTAARDADPHVIIMDPLIGHWKFQHAHDGLHPTAAGDAWIARKVASLLRADGVHASPADVTTAIMCDLGIPAKAA